MVAATDAPPSIAPLPADPLGVRFLQWFSHPWAFIHAENPAPGERAKWVTETRYPLQPRNLWSWHQNPNSLLGLRFGKVTRYCLLDIDASSPYHPSQNERALRIIEGALEDIGLCRSITIRSSDSGGIHIYYFLPAPVPSFGLACAIKYALLDAGFPLVQGQLEIFPNCKAFSKGGATLYNGHRLPLQPNSGSFILGFDFHFESESISELLDQADWVAAGQDMEELEAAIIASRKKHKAIASKKAPSGNAEQWRQHLEERIAQGWTGDAQTNDLLKDFGQYGRVFLGLGGQELAQYVERTATAAPGYGEWCGHQENISRRAAEWATACEKWWSPYCSYPERNGEYQQAMAKATAPGASEKVISINAVNIRRREIARKRIQQAVEALQNEGRWPASPTERTRLIREISAYQGGHAIGMKCLYKHRELWHPTAANDKENLISEKRISCGRIAISSSYECSAEGENFEFSESTNNLHIEGGWGITQNADSASIPDIPSETEFPTPPTDSLAENNRGIVGRARRAIDLATYRESAQEKARAWLARLHGLGDRSESDTT